MSDEREDPGSPSQEALPIDALRDTLLPALVSGPVVLTSPTGSGKSTQVPRWCLDEGLSVVVVEPRRVACKTLAARVAELEGVALGTNVGYQVRDDDCTSAATRVSFMTPGIVLRRLDDVLGHDVVIVDELHERGMDTDLILALLRDRHRGHLLAMSATLEGDRVAAYLGGQHVSASARQFPVTTRHLGGPLLPSGDRLEARVRAALAEARDLPGDVLVFLPGKAEIMAVASTLAHAEPTLEVLPLHGALSLAEQSRAFQPSARRKVVLATNVAETSVTVPGVGVVIDSGLVRRTRYHRGRGFLTLMAVAEDSAAQRAGRAGRTMPGTCLRLWQEAGRLETSTPPEIHRESLLPLVLGAAACGASVDTLAFLDPPADYAVAAAREEALALGALDASGTMTATGRDLFGLPLDPPLGRLLLEAKRRGTLPDAIDLVAALATGRPLFERSLGAPSDDPRDLRYACCDATALVLAVRRGRPGEDRLIAATLKEARSIARRLRRVMGLAGDPDRERPVDREALCRTALAADPRSAHVARERRRHVAWSNGGTEIELARESAAQHAERVEALVVFETRALAKSAMKTSILATCASPAPLPWFAAEGLGRERVARAKRQGDAYVVEVERVFARKVVATRRVVPEGPLARQAVAQLVMAGDLFGGILPSLRQRLDTQNLAARLATRGLVEGVDLPELDLAAWLEQRLAELGLEQMDDLALLTAEDLLPPELPWAVAQVLEREFPKEVRTREARYAVEIDVAQGEVTLRYLEGSRGQVPRKSALPAFVGFKVKVDTGRGMALVDR